MADQPQALCQGSGSFCSLTKKQPELVACGCIHKEVQETGGSGAAVLTLALPPANARNLTGTISEPSAEAKWYHLFAGGPKHEGDHTGPLWSRLAVSVLIRCRFRELSLCHMAVPPYRPSLLYLRQKVTSTRRPQQGPLSLPDLALFPTDLLHGSPQMVRRDIGLSVTHR